METLIIELGKLLQAIVVPIAIAWACALIRKRYAVDISEADERRLREFARQGVAWAEEQTRKALKSPGSVPPPPSEKLQMAKQFVDRRVRESKIKGKKVAPEAVHDLVEAELGRKRSALSGLTQPPGRNDAH